MEYIILPNRQITTKSLGDYARLLSQACDMLLITHTIKDQPLIGVFNYLNGKILDCKKLGPISQVSLQTITDTVLIPVEYNNPSLGYSSVTLREIFTECSDNALKALQC